MRHRHLLRGGAVLLLLVLGILLARRSAAPGASLPLTPVSSRIVRGVVAVRTWATAVRAVLTSPQRMTALTEENAILRGERDRAIRLAADGDACRALTGSALPIHGSVSTAAAVVAATRTQAAQELTIVRMPNAAMAVGDPVLGSAGLVGVLTAVGDRRAVVRLLGDPSSLIGVARASGGGVAGLLRAYVGGGVAVTQVPVGNTLQIGDAVVTVAVDASVPPGIPIGRITDLRTDADGFFATGAMELLDDPFALSFVRVLHVP